MFVHVQDSMLSWVLQLEDISWEQLDRIPFIRVQQNGTDYRMRELSVPENLD